MTSKEKILDKLAQGMHDAELSADTAAAAPPQPPEATTDDDLPVAFAEKFAEAGGMIYYCASLEELGQLLPRIMKQQGADTLHCSTAQLATFLNNLPQNEITIKTGSSDSLCAMPCQALLAADGSTVITEYQGLGTAISSVPNNIILIAFTSQVTTDWTTAAQVITEQYGSTPNYIYAIKPQPHNKLYMLMIEDQN